MVHEGCAVDKTLIVDTNHHGLVHAIDGDMVHHILLAAQKLLTQNCRALCSDLLLGVHQQMEVLGGFLLHVAQLHAVRARRLHWFDNHRHLLGVEKRFHVGMDRTTCLLHGPQASCFDELLLEFLVAPVPPWLSEPSALLRHGHTLANW